MKQASFLTEDHDADAAAEREQFRMRRLQVYNWGTFSGLHDIAIAPEGFLFVGRSGSGKSTLLDAFASLLVPPIWLSFNAAAREGDRSRGDRSVASYIRGAWADQKDSGSGEIATRYLRPGTTWSALALTFENGSGRSVSLIQLYWLKGTASGNTDVRRHFMICQRPFDIAGELEGFDLDIRSLKRRLDDALHFETFRPYGERFRQLLGIASEMALKLLHRTQSAKNIGDLNTFLREFMLDRPDTFDAADRLVSEFAELDSAHQAVITARQQVETLRPAKDASGRLNEVADEVASFDHLLAGIDVHTDQTRVALLRARSSELEVRLDGLGSEARQRSDRLTSLQVELGELESSYREQGGGRIERLEHERQAAEQLRDERGQRRRQAEAACSTLDWELPSDAHGFAELIGRARGEVENWQAGQDQADADRDALRDAKQAAEKTFAEVRREIDAMERQPSNIEAHMLDLRRVISEALGLPEADLPFAGELIEVREDAQEWRAAAERVLRGLALALLVDPERYPAVTQFVNEHHLGQRLVYFRIGDARLPTERPALNSLVRKLDVKTSVHGHWLEAELQRRFDYACVDNMRDFRASRRAITREGQVRHGPDRHEKDDRRRIDDPSKWVLGFDNRDKLALFKRRAQEAGVKIARLDENIARLRETRREQQTRFEFCTVLVNLSFTEIDLAPLLDRINELDAEIKALRSGNRSLEALTERINATREAIGQADGALREVKVSLERAREEREQTEAERKKMEQVLSDAEPLTEAQRSGLTTRFEAGSRLTLNNLDARRTAVERGINGELTTLRQEQGQLEKRIEQAFGAFKHHWPSEGADMDASIDAIPEFMALLQRLERDGLPAHEQRFFELLKEQSSENLAALNARISQGRKEIRERMELVNEGLAGADFNPGTHLEIEVSDRHLPDVREFRDQVRQVLEHAWQIDREQAEARFLVLRALVAKLGGEDPEHRRWREQVLDVRLHVEFIGRELDGEGREVEVYRSGAGKSGGQREKLATTCLAAALRYQLGGAAGEVPIYAPVILDEAFARADNEFTELVMKIFQRFGFQMIVATPLKSVMTLEPFIGGACFVDIADRRRSSTLAIAYDRDQARLDLPSETRGQNLSAHT